MEVLSEIIQDYPDVKIRLVSGNADEMETALKHGTIDFAVLMAHRSLDSYHHLQLPETDRWGLAMQKDNPLAQKTLLNLLILLASRFWYPNKLLMNTASKIGGVT